MKIALWYMCGFLSHKLECTFSKQNRNRTEPKQNQNRTRTETEHTKRIKHNQTEQARTEQNTT